MVSSTPLPVLLLMSVLVLGAVNSSLSVQVSVDTRQEDVTGHPEAQHTDPGHRDHAIHLGNNKTYKILPISTM